ncbi:TPA: hypothetical protein QB624_000401 [Pasteurella multocida]|nr:hypothetical protein [Pasteurella multocida]
MGNSNELKYGLQTYATTGDITYSTESPISNVTIIGFVDVKHERGDFYIEPDKIPPGKSFFYFPTFSLTLGFEDQASPKIQLYPYYTENGGGTIHGFWWQTFIFSESAQNTVDPNAPQLRIYYGFY